ncbi:MAG: hypothetical protein HRT90_11125, partial [Candidatus Margulisbacteria bacterium]|nr:hypothetical protein [Candidatus Margulisiibacteriota bacterium]
YAQRLTSTQNQFKLLLSNPTEKRLVNLLNNENNESFIFMLMTGLPKAQINTLFLYIQDYFPEDLEIMIGTGNRLNITSLFQTPSDDMNYLIEKIKIYFRLFFSTDLPIIKHITRSKTKDFLLELLKNTTIKKETHQNLRNTLEQQINFRYSLYKIWIDQLESYIPTLVISE